MSDQEQLSYNLKHQLSKQHSQAERLQSTAQQGQEQHLGRLPPCVPAVRCHQQTTKRQTTLAHQEPGKP